VQIFLRGAAASIPAGGHNLRTHSSAMTNLARRAIAHLLDRTPLGLWPVRVRSGIASGARWTLYPWTSYWRGTHEPALQAEMMALGNGDIRGWACWDLGAHFGLYSVGLARRVGPRGEIAAFEPNPASFARLERHRRMNRLTWLKLFPAAVSDHNRGAELFTYGELGTTTTHLPYDGETRTTDVGALSIRTIRLDDLVNRGELRVPNFIKVDVEGHGHHAIAGMREALRTSRPIIIMAFHSPQEITGTMEILEPLGYTWRESGTHPFAVEIISGRDYVFLPGHRRELCRPEPNR
jgi:FkbM family methyltransferase